MIINGYFRTTFQLTNDVRAFLRKPRSINDIKVTLIDY